jgi:SagB-type dehydrogenase family enzyme
MKINDIKNKYDQNDISIYGKSIDELVALLYHENSKFCEHDFKEKGLIISSFTQDPFLVERSIKPYKCYSNSSTIDLNEYIKIDLKSDFIQLLKQRRSLRDFDINYKISLFEITNLLFHSYGVTQKAKVTGFDFDGDIGLRNVPSGGGLYPLELYVVILNGHIENGLYHYRSDSNKLELLKKGDFKENLRNIIMAEPYVNIKSCSCVILTTGIIERLVIKYGERGYRFMLQEVGFVNHSITLIAEALGLGSCYLGGYIDDKVNDFIGIDGVFETIHNVLVIGKKNNNLNCEI